MARLSPSSSSTDGRQPDSLQPGQPCGELGVEQARRPHPDVGQARQVLGGRVQHPLRVGERGADGAEVGQGGGIDQHRPGPRAPQLHQVGALAVAVAGRALGVDGDRAGAGREGGDRVGESGRVGHDRRDAVPWGVEGTQLALRGLDGLRLESVGGHGDTVGHVEGGYPGEMREGASGSGAPVQPSQPVAEAAHR